MLIKPGNGSDEFFGSAVAPKRKLELRGGVQPQFACLTFSRPLWPDVPKQPVGQEAKSRGLPAHFTPRGFTSVTITGECNAISAVSDIAAKSSGRGGTETTNFPGCNTQKFTNHIHQGEIVLIGDVSKQLHEEGLNRQQLAFTPACSNQ
jgi:hypothetical protein